MRLNLNRGLAHIRGQVDQESLTNACSDKGCTAHLDGIPTRRVVIDVEKEFDLRGDSGSRCDRLLFYGHTAKETFIAVPIELKGGKPRESEVRKQLESGLKFATTLAPHPRTSGKTVYVPVLFQERGINWANPRLRQQLLRVNFQGKSVRVLIGRCGRKKNLARLLSEAGYL